MDNFSRFQDLAIGQAFDWTAEGEATLPFTRISAREYKVGISLTAAPGTICEIERMDTLVYTGEH